MPFDIDFPQDPPVPVCIEADVPGEPAYQPGQFEWVDFGEDEYAPVHEGMEAVEAWALQPAPQALHQAAAAAWAPGNPQHLLDEIEGGEPGSPAGEPADPGVECAQVEGAPALDLNPVGLQLRALPARLLLPAYTWHSPT